MRSSFSPLHYKNKQLCQIEKSRCPPTLAKATKHPHTQYLKAITVTFWIISLKSLGIAVWVIIIVIIVLYNCNHSIYQFWPCLVKPILKEVFISCYCISWLCCGISYVTLGMLLTVSVPQFPYLQNGLNTSIYPTGFLLGFSKVMLVKCFANSPMQ